MRIFSRIGVALVSLLCAESASLADEAVDKLLAMMPGDAGFVIVVDRPQRALPPTLIEPVLKAIAPDEKAADELLDALKKIPGPFVIGMLPRLDGKGDGGFEAIVAIAIDRPDLSFEDWYEKHFFPPLQAMAANDGGQSMRLERGEGTVRVMGPGDEMVFGFAVKEKVAFGSNKANRVLRWKRGEYPKKPWVGRPGVRRMLNSLPKESNARVLVNPRAFVEALPNPKKNSWEELAQKVIAPEEFEAAAIDLTWEKRSLRLRATIALAEECKGLAGILSRPSTECRQLGIFPDDFAVVGRLGWSSAQGVMDGIFSLTDLFDKTISAEYREDLATFETEAGVNWDGDVLGQLVGEAAFGLRVDFTRKNPFGWATVLPLGDHAAFGRQIDQLISHFELPVETKEREGVAIRGGGESMPIAFAVLRDVFVIADSPETILDLSKRSGRQNGEPTGKSMRACYKNLEKPNQLAIMLDLETLIQKAPIIMMGAGPKIGPLISRGTVSLAMWSKERMAMAELVWDMGRPMEHEKDEKGEDAALIAVVEVMTESLISARNEAQRVVSMSNMRSVGAALQMYAADRKGAFPESLEEMLRASPNAISLETFRCPYDGSGPNSIDELTQKSYLVYRAGLNQSSPADEVVLAEKTTYDNNGANFLFVDGHVEFIPEPRAGELIGLMKSGADSIKR